MRSLTTNSSSRSFAASSASLRPCPTTRSYSTAGRCETQLLIASRTRSPGSVTEAYSAVSRSKKASSAWVTYRGSS
ncbi:putative signal peptide protein [Halorubrum sp. AJ67]|nr:putative signal peptide protein [Halorubrum sp. AJ67]